MSGNKILTSGPYSGLSLEEVVAADPWYIVHAHAAGGNHGISNGTYERALRLVEDYEQAELHQEIEDMSAFQLERESGIDDIKFAGEGYDN